MIVTFAYLESRAVIRLTGPDWRSFLQGLITQDVETLSDGQARFGALLTPQGRLAHDMFIVGAGEDALLDVAATARDGIIDRLSIYRLRAKVQITPDPALVTALFGAGAAPAPGWLPDPRLSALGFRGYGAASPAEAIVGAETDYEAFRLSLGAPGPADWDAQATYPIEANFDLLSGIDFKKGCFIGQETTSRMKRRGLIKTRMLPIRFEGSPPSPGAEVLAGDLRAGEVLSGREGIAMALLRLDRIDGAALSVDGRPVRAERPTWMAP